MVAASKAHFSHNPFYCPKATEAVSASTRRRPLSDFVTRSERAPDELYLSPENRYYKMIARAMKAGDSDTNLYQLRRSYVREKKSGLCPTLTANMGVGGHNVPFVRDEWGIRRLHVSEVARLQGFDPDDLLFPDIPVSEQYRLLGNAACVHLTRIVAERCVDILRERGSV